MQLNARFVFLSSVTCPVLPVGEERRVHCSSHAGTYFGEMGVRTQGGARLHVVAGGVDQGLARVTLHTAAGVTYQLNVGDMYGEPNGADVETAYSATERSQHGMVVVPDTEHRHHARHHAHSLSHQHGMNDTQPSVHAERGSAMYVHRLSSRSLLVHVGVYELLLENSDRYVDLVWVAVTNWTALFEHVQPNGLLGRTHHRDSQGTLSAEQEEQHREQDGDVFGCNVQQDKHCRGEGEGEGEAAAAA